MSPEQVAVGGGAAGGGAASSLFVTPAALHAGRSKKRGNKRQREEDDQEEEKGEEEVAEKAGAEATKERPLTAAELDHYTRSVLKRKGVELRSTTQASSGRRTTIAPKYQLELINLEGRSSTPAFSKADLRKISFNTEDEALKFVRGEGRMVSHEDLVEHAQKDPYKPLIDAMKVAVDRLGIGGAGETFAANVRAKEAKILVDFYEECLLKPQGGWIRVGGLPGTGKTLTVEHTERLLSSSLASKGLEARPAFVQINCQTRIQPVAFLQNIVDQLGLSAGQTSALSQSELLHELKSRLAPGDGKRTRASSSSCGAAAASSSGEDQGILQWSKEKANDSIGKSVILVLDEADKMVEAQETLQLLTDIVALAMEPRSRLALMTVANTIDDQSLSTSIYTRVTETVNCIPPRDPLIFGTFNKDQLLQILNLAVGNTFHVSDITRLTLSVPFFCLFLLCSHNHPRSSPFSGSCLESDC